MSNETPTVQGLRVLDEGVTTVNPATSMDMVGAGVTATDGGNGKATVTIPGGGGSTIVVGEILTDNGDGTYTLAHTPTAGTLAVYKNGIRIRSGSGNDYTQSTTVVTRLDSYVAGETWTADYQY